MAGAIRLVRSVGRALLVACALYGTTATVLDLDTAFRHYVADRWGSEQGLPQLSVLSITQDTTG